MNRILICSYLRHHLLTFIAGISVFVFIIFYFNGSLCFQNDDYSKWNKRNNKITSIVYKNQADVEEVANIKSPLPVKKIHIEHGNLEHDEIIIPKESKLHQRVKQNASIGENYKIQTRKMAPNDKKLPTIVMDEKEKTPRSDIISNPKQMQEKQRVESVNGINIQSVSKENNLPPVQKISKEWPRVHMNNCNQVEFMNKGINSIIGIKNRQYPRTGIVSFPGSGNTWSRHLIEQATGLYTGSVYVDKALYAGGFKGELDACSENSTVAIKSHYPKFDPMFCELERIILVIRDPYRAVLSEFNWRATGQHTGVADVRLYKTKIWRDHVQARSGTWLSSTQTWLERFTGGEKGLRDDENPFTAPSQSFKKLLLVSYERLKSNTLEEMERVHNFLGLPVFRSHCIQADSTGKFHRVTKSLESVACMYKRFDLQQEVAKKINSLKATAKKLGVGDITREFEGIDKVSTEENC